jgi:Ca2+-binding RTX toxin-like protein
MERDHMAGFTGSNSGDIYVGGADADQITGNGGNDSLSGNGGNDDISGNAGADTLDGGEGDDRLYGGTRTGGYSLPYYGNSYTPPTLDTGGEVDVMRGGAGDDRIFAGYGDSVDGGENGAMGDYLFVSFLGAPSGVTVDFRQTTLTIGGGTISNIENISWVQGSNFDDDINVAGHTHNGYSDFTAVFAAGGNDHLQAGYYTGVLYGEDGNDIVDGRGSQYLQRVDGGNGDDVLYTNSNTFAVAWGGNGNDTIYAHGEVHGGAGNDRIDMQASYYTSTVYGDEGNDEINAVAEGNPNAYGNTMAGGTGADRITGGANADYLVSGELPSQGYVALDAGLEKDTLTGGAGNDRLAGGYGDDIDGGDGSDTLSLSFAGATSGVIINLTGITGPSPYVFAGATIRNVETFERLTGSSFADTITIGSQPTLVIVDGGSGDDAVTSAGSSVEFNGGAGDDRFVSGAAGDVFRGGDGFDTVDYSGYAGEITVTLGASGVGPGGDTLVEVEQVMGTAFSDTLSGGSADEALNGGDGTDSLAGNAGDDSLDGGAGSDTLNGGTGADRLTGGAGNDSFMIDNSGDRVIEMAGGGVDSVTASVSWTLGAGQEVETVTAAEGNALDLTGNDNNNVLAGNSSANALSGAGGADSLNGGDGNDTLDGGAGADLMTGGAGDDVYNVDNAGDSLIEEVSAGNDTVRASISWTLAQNIENLVLLSGAQAGTGNGLNNVITGNSQGNALSGAAGNDTLDGGAEADTLTGGAGDDVYIVDDAGDQVVESAGGGSDRIVASINWTLAAGLEIENLMAAASGAFDLSGNELANAVTGNDSANFLRGLAGADTLTGAGGNDILDGGTGADRMAGGVGNDTYYADSAGDSIVEEASAGIDTVLAATNWTLGANVENLTLLDGVAAGTGNGVDNLLTGNGQANTLSGDAGNDMLLGGEGNDQLSGDAGHDLLLGGDGADILNGGGGNDHLFGQSSSGGADGADSLSGGDGTDYLQGNAGNDTLVGGSGGDRINGGANDDLINGGSENDTVNGNLGSDVIDGGTGNDSLRGGRGDDVIAGGDGNDVVMGDLGVDTLSGGAGNDLFLFGGDAALFGGAAADRITDFQDGIDHIGIGHAVVALLTGAAQQDFSAAAVLAQQMFDGHAGAEEVAAIQVGADTYLFYSSNNLTTVDSAVQLIGVGSISISTADFI